MTNKLSITIGIPAYNEQQNITDLLHSIQKQDGYKDLVDKVIILSDGSTDGTVKNAIKVKDEKTIIIEEKINKGKNFRINQLMKINKSDIFIQIDGDCLLLKKNVLLEFVNTFKTNQDVDLVCGSHIPQTPENIIEKIGVFGFNVWQHAVLNLGENSLRYKCIGNIRAFSNRFTSKFIIPKGMKSSEDIYSFYFAKQNNLKVISEPNVQVVFRVPANINDYKKQMIRFINSAKMINKYFPSDLIRKYEVITFKIKISSLIRNIIKKPLIGICYIFLQALIKMESNFKSTSEKWDTISSTKQSVNNKKTLIFSSYDDTKNPYYGGGGAYSIHKIASLLVDQYKIIVYTAKYPNSRDEVIDGVEYKRISYNLFDPRLSQLLYQLVLPYYVITSSFDVWFENFTPPYSTAFLPFFTSKPVIGTVNLLSGESKSKEFGIPFYLLEQRGIKIYKNFICLTEELKNKIKKINPDANCTVIPHGTEKVNIKSYKEGKNYILYIGRIDIYHKGLDLLLESLYKLKKRKKFKLYIAGNGTPASLTELNKIIVKFKLEKQVKLLGKVSGVYKITIIKNSKFIVMPSRIEGQGVVALEALSYGKALICFDIDELKWIKKGLAMKITPFDVSKLSLAIEKLITDQSLRSKYFNSGRNFSKRYAWESIVAKYKKYLKEIL